MLAVKQQKALSDAFGLAFMQVGREYRVQKALFSAGFPVPQPLLHSTDVEVIGMEFYLMEHVQVNYRRS